jgi:anti-anti-sigma factor
MGIHFEKDEAGSLVVLEGAIDIACAAELKALLLEALNAQTEVRISLDDATYLDVTAFQLLWAAAQQARRCGVELRFSGQTPEPVSIALAEAGFQPFLVSVQSA